MEEIIFLTFISGVVNEPPKIKSHTSPFFKKKIFPNPVFSKNIELDELYSKAYEPRGRGGAAAPPEINFWAKWPKFM